MQPAGTNRSASMWRSTSLVMLTVITLSLLAGAWVSARTLLAQYERDDRQRLSGIVGQFAPVLRTRLQLADALVRYLTAADTGADEDSLRRSLQRSESFVGVALVPWSRVGNGRDQTRAADWPTTLHEFSPAERLELSTGQSVLKVVAADQGPADVYLAHMLVFDGQREIGFFKLSSGWLWRGLDELPDGVSLAVLQPSQHLMLRGPALAAPVVASLSSAEIDAAPPRHAVMVSWRQGTTLWHAAVLQISLNGGVAGAGWNIAAFENYDVSGFMLPFLPGALIVLAVAVLAALLGSTFLTQRWEPVLERLEAALLALGQGTFQRVEIGRAADTPRRVAQSHNRALGELQQRLSAQACLAEIDRLLFEARELEQTLEPALLRVRALTGAHAVAIALIDQDATGHARSFAISSEDASCPVARINVDGETLTLLREQRPELNVSAEHLDRYSFLEPLDALGADSCRAWPISIGERIAAILSVGFRGPITPTRQQLAFGAECAARLQLALSNQDRDERLYRQAHFDSLTSLPNRLLFRDRLSQELAHVAETAQRGALLYVDLDHFKQVNDSVGHIAGDQLLTIIAQRLRACVKESDTVARLGGDEFTVILRYVPSAEAAGAIAERIVEALQRPVSIGGRDHSVRASVGITLFPDDGGSIDQLMRNADLAMYQAKDSGRARVVFFDNKMTRTSLRVADTGLYRALKRREFALHYQPQFQVATGELIALEALLRWQSPREGLRAAADFIAAAERSGLIVDIGAWVLDAACQQLQMWRERGIAPARVALNVSVQQLQLPDFAQRVQQSLARVALPASMLELEITQAALGEEPVRECLGALSGLGVRLTLAGFGAGALSVGTLRQYPIDAVKIDRSFMHEVPGDVQACTLAGTIIDTAHALGQQAIAEGIESLRQLDFLRERGCDAVQGFVLSRPLSADETTDLLAGPRGSELLLRAAG
jgi:diguanylate cyclase (GGDEF)-like protein